MAKRVFISVPMAGKHEDDIYKEIYNAQQEYRALHPNEEIEFVDNYYVIHADTLPLSHPALLYLGEAIKKMSSCDDVFFYGDWENARGCKVEKLVYDLYFAT